MLKNLVSVSKKMIMLLFMLFWINFNGLKINAYATIGDFTDGNSNNSFNPDNYEINYNKKHNYTFWRHEDGHSFTDQARVFYDIPGIKLVPCRTYQEFANNKQLINNGVSISLNFIPPAKLFQWGKGLFNVMRTSITEKMIDDKDDKIAIINDVLRYFLLNDPGKGFFFLETDQLTEIKQIDITFCECVICHLLC